MHVGSGEGNKQTDYDNPVHVCRQCDAKPVCEVKGQLIGTQYLDFNNETCLHHGCVFTVILIL